MNSSAQSKPSVANGHPTDGSPLEPVAWRYRVTDMPSFARAGWLLSEEPVTVKHVDCEPLYGPNAAARIAELEARIGELEEQQKGMVPLADDLSSVFIDGFGSVAIDLNDNLLSRALKAEALLEPYRASLSECERGLSYLLDADGIGLSQVLDADELADLKERRDRARQVLTAIEEK